MKVDNILKSNIKKTAIEIVEEIDKSDNCDLKIVLVHVQHINYLLHQLGVEYPSELMGKYP